MPTPSPICAPLERPDGTSSFNGWSEEEVGDGVVEGEEVMGADVPLVPCEVDPKDVSDPIGLLRASVARRAVV